ncbi:MAG: hypothetical protein AB7V32_00870 [Candidatus Berkiella sp.]
MTNSGPTDTLTKENVQSIYVKAASEGNTVKMLEIDKLDLCEAIDKDARLKAICEVLPIVPYPVALYYMNDHIKGVTPQMRQQIISHAQEQQLISANIATTFIRHFEQQSTGLKPEGQTAATAPTSSRKRKKF